ncbi:SDR family NAD(P)-dependent oxidoreductase [Streptomyces sp. 1331.2]|uniref:SDR family NAD(P)-dependent oxidoreductase n=1 Tax=Streptomyces sp. 1331.2 TaxID=1938835 RepID=UPI000BCED8E6|nr:SDR family NAD(P)-dependent oxidoreductase [Streptomyces sp. 1331.2]SOB85706.1 NADP-dependent 3-hydroxy acid dehydrogenase YdfG [Streptomyces sp. 1331.2]
MHVSADTASRVWFITGASRGLGRAFAEAALTAGDRVAVAARTTAPLDELAAAHPGRVLPLGLDVTDRDAVFAAVAEAVAHFGRLDIVVNNAGMLSMGMVEEFTEAEARAQLDTNFFGALWVSQAVIPVLREQGSGHLVQVSSIAALGGFPSTGLYSASKFALEGLSEALAAEAAGFGVKLTIVQPGGYWTDLYTAMRNTSPLEAYAPLREELAKQFAEGSVDSDPKLAAAALLKLVDSDEPPLRLLLGSMVYDLAFDIVRTRMATWAAWEKVSRAAEHAIPGPVTADAAAEPREENP